MVAKFSLADLQNSANKPNTPPVPTTAAPSNPTDPNATSAVPSATQQSASGHRIIQGRAVTEQERAQYAEMRKQGISIKKIAEQFGRQPAVVYNHLKKMGLTKSREGTPQEGLAGITLVDPATGKAKETTPPPAAPGVPQQPTTAKPANVVGKPKNLMDLLGGGSK